ncbi:MAG: cyclase family protein [Methanobrevibacter sp.]|jgi:kynurenine formamidase|nr:cyclase family protein [Candidatus Methanovirga australis]
MTLIDLTHKLEDNISVFPDDPEFRLKTQCFNKEYRLSELKSGLHSGTHIDSPYHYIKNGKKVFEIELNDLMGKTDILSLENTTNKEIAIESLKIPENTEKIIILKTGWFKEWTNKNYFKENFYLSKEIAKLFIDLKIKGIAIDTPNVDKYGETTIHKLLLKNDIWIVENLTNLDKANEDKYYGFFIPLNINSEASFTRSYLKLLKKF